MQNKKDKIITSICIFLWIFIINIGVSYVTSAQTWPMFFVSIFYFLLEKNKRNLVSIFLSAVIGILFAYIFLIAVEALTPLIGEKTSVIILLFLLLGAIIIGGNWCHLIFNNVTFAFLTISAIDPSIIKGNLISWILMSVIGGAVIVGGAKIVVCVLCRVLKKKSESKSVMTANE